MRSVRAGQKIGVCAHSGHAFARLTPRVHAQEQLVCGRCGVTTEHDTLSFDAKITLVNNELNRLLETLNKFGR